MRKYLLCIAALVGLTSAPALADHRTNIAVTVPMPVTSATTHNTGVGISYAAAKLGNIEIAPFVTVANIGVGRRNIRVQPGIAAQFTVFNMFSIGVAETLNVNGKFDLSHKHFTPSLILGVRL